MTKLTEVPSGFVSTKQAAKLAGYTSDYIGQIAREGRIESVKVGRERFVKVSDVFEYVRQRTEEESAKDTVAETEAKSFTPITATPETVRIHPVAMPIQEDVEPKADVLKKTTLTDEDLIRISRRQSTRLTPIVASHAVREDLEGDNMPQISKRKVVVNKERVELLPSPYSTDNLLLGASKAVVGIAAVVAIFVSGLNFIVQVDSLSPSRVRPAALAAYQLTEVTRSAFDVPKQESTQNQFASPVVTSSSFIDYIARSFFEFVRDVLK